MTGNIRLDELLTRANSKVAEIVKVYEASPKTAKAIGDLLMLTIEFRTRECLNARKSACAEQLEKKYGKLIEADFNEDIISEYTRQIQQIITM